MNFRADFSQKIPGFSHKYAVLAYLHLLFPTILLDWLQTFYLICSWDPHRFSAAFKGNSAVEMTRIAAIFPADTGIGFRAKKDRATAVKL